MIKSIKAYYASGGSGSYLEYELTRLGGEVVEGWVDTVDGDSDGELLNNDIDAIVHLVNSHPSGSWEDVGVNSLEDFSEHVG